jgi:predicted GIY-YIG superfamily endonuclease
VLYFTYVAYYTKKNEFKVGVTANISRRKKILCSLSPDCKIVYYEEFENSKEATDRENELLELPKQLIKELVLENNPELCDISNLSIE